MAYTAQITRQNPSCIIFLIDQSLSMQETFSQRLQISKAQEVADVIGRFLQNLVIKCTKSDGVRHFYDVGVLGYGTGVYPCFGGPLRGRDLVPINEVAYHPSRIEEQKKVVTSMAGEVRTIVVRTPVWFGPVADGGTPMCHALDRCEKVLGNWIRGHPASFPPIVINITDGGATDGDPTPYGDALMRLRTEDGSVLLFNCHITDATLTPITFPETDEDLPEQYARTLFNISSQLPGPMIREARTQGHLVGGRARGFAFNADLVALIQFVDIGTSTAPVRRHY